jgi:hypothetical protein
MDLDEQELRAFLADGYGRLVGRLDGWQRRAWAEDLVQEALVRAWERAARGEPVGSLPAWVTTVATNLARSRLRREQAERRAIERLAARGPGWVPDWPGGPAEEAEVLRELVERLSRRQREVGAMGLKHWGMLSARTGSHEGGLASERFEGRPVAYLRSAGEPAERFGLLFQGIAADDFRGRRVRLSAALKANGVTGYAGLWLRVEGGRPSGTIAFDDMSGRHLEGTTDWREHANVLDVAVEADRIMFGAILSAYRRPRNLGFEES